MDYLDRHQDVPNHRITAEYTKRHQEFYRVAFIHAISWTILAAIILADFVLTYIGW